MDPEEEERQRALATGPSLDRAPRPIAAAEADVAPVVNKPGVMDYIKSGLVQGISPLAQIGRAKEMEIQRNKAITNEPIVPQSPNAGAMDPELLGILAQAAAGGSGPQSVTTSGGATTIKDPEMDPRLMPQYRNVWKERIDAKRNIIAQRDDVLDRKGEMIDGWKRQTEADKKRYGGKAGQFYKRFEEAQGEVARLKKDLDENSVIDPDALWNKMSSTQSVIAMIAVAFSDYSSMGTKGALNMINKATDRDIAVQRANFKQKLAQYDIAASERDKYLTEWNKMEGHFREQANKLSKLELARLGLEDNRLDVRSKFADLIAVGKGDILAKQNLARSRKTKTFSSQTKTVKGGSGSGGLNVDKPTMRKLREKAESFDAGTAMVKDVKNMIARAKSKYALLGKNIPNTLATDINMKIQQLALFNRKAMGDSGPITQKDFKSFNMVTNSSELDRFLTKNTLLRRLNEMQRVIKAAKTRAIKNAYKSPGSFLKDALKESQEKINPRHKSYTTPMK